MENEFKKIGVEHLKITERLANLGSEYFLKRSTLTSTRCNVRLYMISAHSLSSRDDFSPSDPYLFVSCNGKTFNERDNYQLNEPNPDFFKVFDF